MAQSSRGKPGREDRTILETIFNLTVHDISSPGLPAELGNWNGIRKRYWRPSRTDVFEAVFPLLAEQSPTAQLARFFDRTAVRAHVSAAAGMTAERAGAGFARGVTPVIPRRETFKEKGQFFPRRLYKLQTPIEQLAGKLKSSQRIALCCNKPMVSFIPSTVWVAA